MTLPRQYVTAGRAGSLPAISPATSGIRQPALTIQHPARSATQVPGSPYRTRTPCGQMSTLGKGQKSMAGEARNHRLGAG